MENPGITAKIQGAEKITGYTFNNSLLLWEALQAAGSPVHFIGGRRLENGNKRLAILGDTVLQLALVEDWYGGDTARGEPLNRTLSTINDLHVSKGQFDRIRQQVGSNVNLDRVCRQAGLDAFINQNTSQLGLISPNTTSATVEAVLGAVYLDSSMDTVKRVMTTLGLVPT